MSTVTTYLTLVFQLEGDMIRATEYFGEQDARRELDQAGIHWPPDRKEIHVSYVISQPLSEEVLDKLDYLKTMGICTGFYVKDEISSDVQALSDKLGIDVMQPEQVKDYWQRDSDDVKDK